MDPNALFFVVVQIKPAPGKVDEVRVPLTTSASNLCCRQ
jgi:hypothetical protein